MPSEARVAAFGVLRRTFEHGAYADRAFHAAAAAGLRDPRDRALAMRLVYGAVQRRLTLDHLIEGLAGRPVERLDPPLRAALRLGLYELLWLDTPPRAVVNDAVELTKPAPGHGLVNAVLRRAASDDGRALLDALDDATPAGAAVRHSVPSWIVDLWWEALGADAARALLRRVNEPAEHALRANTLVVEDAAALVAGLPVAASVPGDPPEAVVVERGFDAHGSGLWLEGAFMPQSRAAMVVARALDPQPGERVLDLCAAPGAKTTHIAALNGAIGEIIAVERHPGRANALRATASRMRATNVRVEVGDAAAADVWCGFDRVLLDPPCSGLGTLQSRPDIRWRASAEAVAVLATEQARLLSVAAAALRPGGTLVYSTCTISPAENERQIDAFLDGNHDFAVIDFAARFPSWAATAGPHLQALPHVQGSDGFFVAGLRRSER